jgi:hypothetical protein
VLERPGEALLLPGEGLHPLQLPAVFPSPFSTAGVFALGIANNFKAIAGNNSINIY